jgi:hypothetical protein
MNKVYLVVGVPGSGKSWVCSQLKESFYHVPHDSHIGSDYPGLIKELSGLVQSKPILAETPFSVSQFTDILSNVETVYVLDRYEVVLERYKAREGKAPAPGDRTRQETYRKRARESGSFSGTSQEVLDYLKGKASGK